jgi:glycosyltransferase involved in cell wall biosynthesis
MSNGRILIITQRMGVGGLERKLTDYMRGFLRRGYSVGLALDHDDGGMMGLVPDEVQVCTLIDKSRVPRSCIHRLGQLKRCMTRFHPDVVISASDGAHNLGLMILKRLFFSRIPVLIGIDSTVSERWKPTASDSFRRRIRRSVGRHFVIPCIYPLSDRIIAVSEGVKQDLVTEVGINETGIVVIRNPVDTEAICRKSTESVVGLWVEGGNVPVVLSIGRLVVEKGFDVLIRAVHSVLQEREVRLVIVGEGEQRSKLQDLIHQLRMENSAILIGQRNNPFPYYRMADVFVLSSRFEGFGLVVAEALACNCQVVSTDCPSGPAEILEGGRWGRLVPVDDVQAMAKAITEALDHPIMKGRLSERASDFSLDRAVNSYIQIFRELGVG